MSYLSDGTKETGVAKTVCGGRRKRLYRLYNQTAALSLLKRPSAVQRSARLVL